MKHDRDFYITDSFKKEEYDLLPVGGSITKTKQYKDSSMKMCYKIKKYKHNENILVHYQSWIVDGSGSTAAIFTGSYDNLQEPKGYSWNYDNLVYFDKIVKEESRNGYSYYGNWLYIDTNELAYSTSEEKEDYEKQQHIRQQKLKRITN
jgi:hypothetical protein